MMKEYRKTRRDKDFLWDKLSDGKQRQDTCHEGREAHARDF
jgi:hypothetical protein